MVFLLKLQPLFQTLSLLLFLLFFPLLAPSPLLRRLLRRLLLLPPSCDLQDIRGRRNPAREPFGHRDGVDDGEGVPVAETAGARRWGEAQPVGERRRRPALDAGH
eukprot:gene9130-biopygen5064